MLIRRPGGEELSVIRWLLVLALAGFGVWLIYRADEMPASRSYSRDDVRWVVYGCAAVAALVLAVTEWLRWRNRRR